MARNFIEANKGTPVGSPGRYQVREPVQHSLNLATVSWNTYKLTELILQGFNTGVALYHLSRMRESADYAK